MWLCSPLQVDPLKGQKTGIVRAQRFCFARRDSGSLAKGWFTSVALLLLASARAVFRPKRQQALARAHGPPEPPRPERPSHGPRLVHVHWRVCHIGCQGWGGRAWSRLIKVRARVRSSERAAEWRSRGKSRANRHFEFTRCCSKAFSFLHESRTPPGS